MCVYIGDGLSKYHSRIDLFGGQGASPVWGVIRSDHTNAGAQKD